MESMKFFEYMQYLTESKESEFVISDDDKKVFKDAGFGFKPNYKKFVYPIGNIKKTGDFRIDGEYDGKKFILTFILTNSGDVAYLSKNELSEISTGLLNKYVETCIDVYSSIKSLYELD